RARGVRKKAGAQRAAPLQTAETALPLPPLVPHPFERAEVDVVGDAADLVHGDVAAVDLDEEPVGDEHLELAVAAGVVVALVAAVAAVGHRPLEALIGLPVHLAHGPAEPHHREAGEVAHVHDLDVDGAVAALVGGLGLGDGEAHGARALGGDVRAGHAAGLLGEEVAEALTGDGLGTALAAAHRLAERLHRAGDAAGLGGLLQLPGSLLHRPRAALLLAGPA